MKKELEMKLVEKYPHIFQEYHLSAMESCLGRGIECRDGWFDIIDRTCSQLQWNTDKNNYPQVVCQQLKEKFGSMRFYYELEEKVDEPTNESEGTYQFNIGVKKGEIGGLISAMENQSNYVCEKCGMPGKIYSGGWVRSHCEKCEDIYQKERT